MCIHIHVYMHTKALIHNIVMYPNSHLLLHYCCQNSCCLAEEGHTACKHTVMCVYMNTRMYTQICMYMQ